jgi:hypothetical protein
MGSDDVDLLSMNVQSHLICDLLLQIAQEFASILSGCNGSVSES